MRYKVGTFEEEIVFASASYVSSVNRKSFYILNKKDIQIVHMKMLRLEIEMELECLREKLRNVWDTVPRVEKCFRSLDWCLECFHISGAFLAWLDVVNSYEKSLDAKKLV